MRKTILLGAVTILFVLLASLTFNLKQANTYPDGCGRQLHSYLNPFGIEISKIRNCPMVSTRRIETVWYYYLLIDIAIISTAAWLGYVISRVVKYKKN